MSVKSMKFQRLTLLVSISFITISLWLAGCNSHKDRLVEMTNIWVAFHNYALDHGGWFPRNDTNYYAALQLLYPNYSPACELAGLSGDYEATITALKQGEPLTGNLSSWVYPQGLREDDGLDLALLWERRAGVRPTGNEDPSGGHAVLFISGEIKQIPGPEWDGFLKKQEFLRKTAIEAHGAGVKPAQLQLSPKNYK